MKVIINISGAGTAKGAGTYQVGESVSIEAVSAVGMLFKHWQREDFITEENPYSFTAGSEDMIFNCLFYQPIETWLRNQVGYPITDEQIISVEDGRGIRYRADVKSVSTKDKELAFADLLTIIITMPSKTAEEDRMGNWMHKGAGLSMRNISALSKIADGIYSKYGESRGGIITGKPTIQW